MTRDDDHNLKYHQTGIKLLKEEIKNREKGGYK